MEEKSTRALIGNHRSRPNERSRMHMSRPAMRHRNRKTGGCIRKPQIRRRDNRKTKPTAQMRRNVLKKKANTRRGWPIPRRNQPLRVGNRRIKNAKQLVRQGPSSKFKRPVRKPQRAIPKRINAPKRAARLAAKKSKKPKKTVNQYKRARNNIRPANLRRATSAASRAEAKLRAKAYK